MKSSIHTKRKIYIYIYKYKVYVYKREKSMATSRGCVAMQLRYCDMYRQEAPFREEKENTIVKRQQGSVIIISRCYDDFIIIIIIIIIIYCNIFFIILLSFSISIEKTKISFYFIRIYYIMEKNVFCSTYYKNTCSNYK